MLFCINFILTPLFCHLYVIARRNKMTTWQFVLYQIATSLSSLHAFLRKGIRY